MIRDHIHNHMAMCIVLWCVKPLSPLRWSPKVNSEIRKNVHIQQKRDIMMMMSTVIMMTMMMRIMTMINCALSCPPMPRKAVIGVLDRGNSNSVASLSPLCTRRAVQRGYAGSATNF